MHADPSSSGALVHVPEVCFVYVHFNFIHKKQASVQLVSIFLAIHIEKVIEQKAPSKIRASNGVGFLNEAPFKTLKLEKYLLLYK